MDQVSKSINEACDRLKLSQDLKGYFLNSKLMKIMAKAAFHAKCVNSFEAAVGLVEINIKERIHRTDKPTRESWGINRLDKIKHPLLKNGGDKQRVEFLLWSMFIVMMRDYYKDRHIDVESNKYNPFVYNKSKFIKSILAGFVNWIRCATWLLCLEHSKTIIPLLLFGTVVLSRGFWDGG